MGKTIVLNDTFFTKSKSEKCWANEKNFVNISHGTLVQSATMFKHVLGQVCLALEEMHFPIIDS